MSAPARKVIIDGRNYYDGHADAWRAGTADAIPDRGQFDFGPPQYMVFVECQPRGRERKPRRIACSIAELLNDTPEARATLAKSGIDPDKAPREWQRRRPAVEV